MNVQRADTVLLSCSVLSFIQRKVKIFYKRDKENGAEGKGKKKKMKTILTDSTHTTRCIAFPSAFAMQGNFFSLPCELVIF